MSYGAVACLTISSKRLTELRHTKEVEKALQGEADDI